MVASVVLVLGLLATYSAILIATQLGFDLHVAVLYPASALILGIAIASPWFSVAIRARFHSILRGNYPLLLLLLVCSSLRLVFAYFASLLPDEYTILGILESKPISNLPHFLQYYWQIAGGLNVHPPLAFVLMDIGYSILPTPLGARLVSVCFSIASILIVYGIVIELGKRQYALLVSAVYGLIPHTVLYMSSALTDVYMSFFGLLAILLFIKATRSRILPYTIFAGIALGLSLWSKQALPFFWIIVIGLLSMLPLHHARRLRRLASFLGTVVIGLFIFYLWSIIDLHAFNASVQPLLGFLSNTLINPSHYRIISTNPERTQIATVTTTAAVVTTIGGVVTTIARTVVTTTAQASNFLALFPQLTGSRESSVSFQELVVQMPLWLSPVVVLLGVWGLKSIRRRRESGILFVWLILPILAMIPSLRDVRYLLLFSVPVAYFAGLGSTVRNRRLRQYLRSIMFAFIFIFLLITASVAQQQYYGVAEASSELSSLGFASARILTNAPQILYYLPHATVVYLPPDYNASMALSMISQDKIDAVVIIQNARAAWLPVGASVRSAISSAFLHYNSDGSSFSWYEVYWDKIA
jgi:4-amino-4-deoxy-L-arabinose transferase-like glycosyltransferase